MKLLEIKNPGPKRDHGSIEDLKQSIADIGLINPLTVDEAGNLLAGRRRHQALMELYGTDYEPAVRVLPINGDLLKAFKVSIDENLKRKPLTDPEVAVAIKEYDELKRRSEGERKAGRPEIGHNMTDLSGWSLQKTADDLSISKPAVVKAIKIATAVEEYPDLAKKKRGQAILSEYERRQKAEEVKGKPQYQEGNNIICCLDIKSDYNYVWDIAWSYSELSSRSDEHKPHRLPYSYESLPEAICKAALIVKMEPR